VTSPDRPRTRIMEEKAPPPPDHPTTKEQRRLSNTRYLKLSRLPTLQEVLDRRTRAPLDLFCFYVSSTGIRVVSAPRLAVADLRRSFSSASRRRTLSTFGSMCNSMRICARRTSRWVPLLLSTISTDSSRTCVDHADLCKKTGPSSPRTPDQTGLTSPPSSRFPKQTLRRARLILRPRPPHVDPLRFTPPRLHQPVNLTPRRRQCRRRTASDATPSLMVLAHPSHPSPKIR
jgi:hypothetical protein